MKACSAYSDKSNADPLRFDPPESRVEQADLARAVLRSGEEEGVFEPAKPGGGSRSLRSGDEHTLELARALADAPEARVDSGVAKAKVARLKKQPTRGAKARQEEGSLEDLCCQGCVCRRSNVARKEELQRH